MRRQTDAAIDDDGPALEQHCTNVSRRPYSQPRALQCLRAYTREDNICASVVVVGIVCLTSHLSQHRRRLPRLFVIEYFNRNTVYSHNICF